MDRERMIEVLKKDRDLAMFNPMTGECAPMNEDNAESAEALSMAIAALEAYVPDMNVGKMEPMDVSKTEQAGGWMERNKDRILQAGLEGREVEFRIGGRLFAIREKAQ